METLSPPVAARNLTAWFILASEAGLEDRDYAVLEDSIESRTAVLHETGHVNELLIENQGDIDLFIQAGDIVKGGRQDRTVGTDFIVPARSGRIPLPAFCVEQARWHRRHHESVAEFSGSKEFLASKKARLALHLAKDQDAVWLAVAGEQHSLTHALDLDVCSADSPSSLQLTYESAGLRGAVEEYTGPLEHAPATVGGRVVGVVWAINGAPSHADRYAGPTLFAKVWLKLLRAAAIEAIGQRAPAGAADALAEPAAAAAERIHAWLAGACSGSNQARLRTEEQQLPPRTLLRTRRGFAQHRFEAFDTAWSPQVPVHVAVLAE